MTIHARALLFDNDGTLVSSLDSVNRCWTRWAVEYGLTAEDFARIELHGRPAAEIAADLLPAHVVPQAVARIEDLEVEDVADGGVSLLPGTKDFLSGLPAERWAVVTSATRRLAEARLGAAGILPKTLVAADDITRGKPDPEPYLLAARLLGVDPADCVVFEDAPAGLQAGRAAGMTTVALATTHRAEELTADLVVKDLSALSALVTDAGIEIAVRS
ncbi:HAD family hydrolase [Streptomyces cellulosae]|jgi:sugar-phosphatase|uniref:Sugar-phosphatase n=1 Tax=Streptomyces thermodiastaticus TaxID=44061 RepID=A0ABU0KCD1_9ACTN|nr:HAD family hydrolase [Streptomyces sp. McG7]MDQ0487037.1 sugar-phosphatase [Streptomyces thermodiastaticus]MDX3414144.1 HAD family hydrolase [Streptomyces sp. MD20-1-1]MYQ32565.1 HAD-IA family hydrolase [Streptomyces sp. SID4956]THC58251.1 HAD family hydrolase [Streptomyces sp. Akac8]UVT08811.1 HAD family hydrolase [Streptomyces thermocarboxydus]WSB40446.1 HAD family hydrolase [Streptomyces cellulosae]